MVWWPSSQRIAIAKGLLGKMDFVFSIFLRQNIPPPASLIVARRALLFNTITRGDLNKYQIKGPKAEGTGVL